MVNDNIYVCTLSCFSHLSRCMGWRGAVLQPCSLQQDEAKYFGQVKQEAKVSMCCTKTAAWPSTLMSTLLFVRWWALTKENCSFTTAQPLVEANLADLKVALNCFLAKGETLKLETKSGTPPFWVVWSSVWVINTWTCPPRPRSRNWHGSLETARSSCLISELFFYLLQSAVYCLCIAYLSSLVHTKIFFKMQFN